MKAHESDEGADVLDGHRLHTADLMIVLLLFLQKQNLMRSRDVDRGYVVKSRMESFLKLRHVLRPRARSLCAFLLYR